MKSLGLIIILLSIPYSCLSQRHELRKFDYSKADLIARAIKLNEKESISEFTIKLTAELESSVEKFRCIFMWVCDNIAYDVDYKIYTAKSTFIFRKGVCSGYARLLAEMCSYVNIECMEVHGYAKNGIDYILYPDNIPNHAWNAVKLQDNWYLVDATWAAGQVSSDNRPKFTKSFNESYFLTDPKFLIYNHFPIEEKWKLGAKMDLESFKNSPVYSSECFEIEFSPIDELKGEISGDRLYFKYKTSSTIYKVELVLEGIDSRNEVQNVDFDDHYEFFYEFGIEEKGRVKVYFDNKLAIEFDKK